MKLLYFVENHAFAIVATFAAIFVLGVITMIIGVFTIPLLLTIGCYTSIAGLIALIGFIAGVL